MRLPRLIRVCQAASTCFSVSNGILSFGGCHYGHTAADGWNVAFPGEENMLGPYETRADAREFDREAFRAEVNVAVCVAVDSGDNRAYSVAEAANC